MRNLFNEYDKLSASQKKIVLEAIDGDEISERVLKDRYKDLINECCGEIEIFGLTYEPADVFESVDEVAFRCGYSDFLGTDESIVEVGGKYYESDNIKEAIDDLEEEEEEEEEETQNDD